MIVGLSAFVRLCFGQWISNLGTQISLFGLGLWLFRTDGQLGRFALVAVVVQLSRVFVLRILARRLERWPRRRVMVIANLLGAVGTLGLAAVVALSAGTVVLAGLLPFLLIAAAAEAALVLSFSTLIPALVPADRRGFANGLFATADGLAALVAPFLGALLVAWTGLAGVVLVDGCTFLIALACVVFGTWPQCALRPLVLSPPSAMSDRRVLRRSLVDLWQVPRLRSLLLQGAALMLAFAGAEILFPAWVLALPAGRSRLATALGLSALAYAAGLALWTCFARRPAWWSGIFRLGLAAQALVLLAAGIPGITERVGLWLAGVAGFNLAVPLVLASQQNLWQRWVPESLQPRLFAARYGTDWTARLVAVSAVGPLVDRVLQPALQKAPAGTAMALPLAMLGVLLLLMQLVHWFPRPHGDEKLPRCAS